MLRSSCCTCSSCTYFMSSRKFGGYDRCCFGNEFCFSDYPACFCDNYVDIYEGDE